MAVTLNKAFLERVYVKRGLSTWAIEERYGFSRSRVYTALKRFRIPTRSIAVSHIRYDRSNFNGDACEKAYLVGFAIGDLRVRRHNGSRSDTISIGCGSTKSAQIKLIKELFSKYGRVWTGKPNYRGVINIEAFVNKSFEFLLPDVRDYTWCAKSKRHFFAFLAGFTDAEGSLFISDDKAVVAWGNYNVDVLRFIKSNLTKFGITIPKLYSDKLKGYIGTHGYCRNRNYCHLACHRKGEIAKMLKELAPYIRHADKKIALVRLKKNLIMRGLS